MTDNENQQAAALLPLAKELVTFCVQAGFEWEILDEIIDLMGWEQDV
jgi:hypothetical protein